MTDFAIDDDSFEAISKLADAVFRLAPHPRDVEVDVIFTDSFQIPKHEDYFGEPMVRYALWDIAVHPNMRFYVLVIRFEDDPQDRPVQFLTINGAGKAMAIREALQTIDIHRNLLSIDRDTDKLPSSWQVRDGLFAMGQTLAAMDDTVRESWLMEFQETLLSSMKASDDSIRRFHADNFVRAVSVVHPSHRMRWLGYMLKSLEERCGIDFVFRIRQLINDRDGVGSW